MEAQQCVELTDTNKPRACPNKEQQAQKPLKELQSKEQCSVFRVYQKVLARYAPLAQLVEQLTLNQWVPGSSP